MALTRVAGWAARPPAAALREVAALRAVDHPHAIRLLDSFSDGGDLCLVTPLVAPGARVFEGGALPLSPAAVARAGHQLASVLAHLHALAPPLLHRDVKPSNLLLQAAPGRAPPPGPLTPSQASSLVEGGALLLSDFGTALLASNPQGCNTATTTGTDGYKAPEIMCLLEYSAAADVWACGATLLQLATGHLAGGTSAARRAQMGQAGCAPWTLQAALDGAFIDKPGSAEGRRRRQRARRSARRGARWARSCGAPLRRAWWWRRAGARARRRCWGTPPLRTSGAPRRWRRRRRPGSAAAQQQAAAAAAAAAAWPLPLTT